MIEAKRKRLGEILVDRNLLLPEQLEAALERKKLTGKRLGQVLIDMGFVSADDVMVAFSQQVGTPHVWLRKGLVDPAITDVLSKTQAEAHCVIPMFLVHGVLTLGMADSSDLPVIDDIEERTGCKVQPVQCRREDIEEAIREHYSEEPNLDDFTWAQPEDEGPRRGAYSDLNLVEDSEEGSRVINLVHLVLRNAVKEGASDIHVELDAAVSRVRYRIDGNLKEVMTPPADLHPAIVSRIKVMAKMDIAERRLPQDGRMRVVAENAEVDVRVSTMPTVLGEKVVMRLLDKTRMTLDINAVGLAGSALESVKGLLRKPYGIILVTGPTGSGKTTTLYCGLAFISTIERNIVTVEDPVEYQLPLINQVQVNEEQGLTFARTLRAVLRQDPDVVMVGEIRDKETAEVAIQAALTGHLVLSTLHTNDSAGAIARLLDMGIEPFLLTSSIIGVVAQRLVRTVCGDCRAPYTPSPELLARVGWSGRTNHFVHGRGCDTCYGTGLKGRTGLFECFVMTDELREAILRDPSVHAIRRASRSVGTRLMKDEAFDLVERGRTTLEEALTVVFVEEGSVAGGVQ